MNKNTFIISLILMNVLAISAFGSARRIVVEKGKEAEAGIMLDIKATYVNPTYLVEIAYSRNQEALKEYWSTDISVRSGNKSALIPLKMEEDASGNLRGAFHVSPETVDDCSVLIRVGRNAPLVETIYNINLSTYIDMGP